MQAFVCGECVESEEGDCSLRYIGDSIQHGQGLAVHMGSGQLYGVKSRRLLSLSSKGFKVPVAPDSVVGTEQWVKWAKDCFEASPLGLNDRVFNSAECNPPPAPY